MKSWKRTVLQLLLLCLFALAGASSIRGRRRPFRSIKAPAGQCAICGAVHIHSAQCQARSQDFMKGGYVDA